MWLGYLAANLKARFEERAMLGLSVRSLAFLLAASGRLIHRWRKLLHRRPRQERATASR